MANIKDLATQLAEMKKTELLDSEVVRQRFIQVYEAIWKEDGEAVFEREKIHFNAALRNNGQLMQCTNISLFIAFIDLAVENLSLAPGTHALCYLMSRNYKTGQRDQYGKEIYEKRAYISISGFGELAMRARSGQIRHADNPVVVYDNDGFQFGEVDGRKFVNYTCNLPHTGHKIIACFLKITRADGSIDYSVMLEEDWLRLKDYSERNNSYYDERTRQRVSKANELYTSNNGSIDTGMLCAKCIKHAFDTYPKLRIGKGTILESETIDQPMDDKDIYGMDMQEADGQRGQESFAPPADTSEGVTIDPEASGSNDDAF